MTTTQRSIAAIEKDLAAAAAEHKKAHADYSQAIEDKPLAVRRAAERVAKTRAVQIRARTRMSELEAELAAARSAAADPPAPPAPPAPETDPDATETDDTPSRGSTRSRRRATT